MFVILIVLYNKSIASSETLHGIIESADILNQSGSKVLLWDNSKKAFDENELNNLNQRLSNFIYRHTPENLALSEIYNKTISAELAAASFKYLLLLDDDSKVDKDYFEKVLNAAQENHPLIIPVVTNKGIIRSPMHSYIIKPVILSNITHGIFPSKNVMAINSGMVISLDFLKTSEFAYDQRLRNYGTDSYFMKFYNSKVSYLYILDYRLEHSLNFFDNSDINRKLEIFRQSKKSFLILHSDNYFHFFVARIYNFLSSAKNAIKHKTFRFFK